jgi:hypothetical protein
MYPWVIAHGRVRLVGRVGIVGNSSPRVRCRAFFQTKVNGPSAFSVSGGDEQGIWQELNEYSFLH